jgi:uncharacterized phiE125 gp8 family phage protein/SPP1 family predicted phage head-tail adaptor
MRYRSLTVETAPAVEPVTLTEAKQHLRVDIADDDTYIEALIVAARQYAEEYLDRALISQQLAMRMDTFPYEFELPRPPMATSGTLTTTAVTYALDPGSASTAVPTTTTLSTSSYRVDRDDTPGRIRTVYNGTWPSHLSDPNAVTVTWWAGYGCKHQRRAASDPQRDSDDRRSPLREPPGGCRYRCCSAGCSVWRKGFAQHGQVGIVPMILPGQLRERVTVEQPGRTTTTLGESQITWSTFATRWASVEGVSSREALQYGQQQIEITHKVRMRYLDGLTHEMRLQWRSRTLDVVSVLEYANRSEHVLICQEQVA